MEREPDSVPPVSAPTLETWTRLFLRVRANMIRVGKLLDSSNPQRNSDGVPVVRLSSLRSDVLRAGIALAHASLEDALRSAARLILPNRPPAILKEIPLVGIGNSRQWAKFTLMEIAEHRGRTVQEVIGDSVRDYLEKRSFSSVDDIAYLLTQMGLQPAEYEDYFAEFRPLMARRHRIVHEMDLSDGDDWGSPCTPAEHRDAERWVAAAVTFSFHLLADASGEQLVPRDWTLIQSFKSLWQKLKQVPASADDAGFWVI